MGSRDSGWIQVYAENVEEIYDRTIQLFRLSEDPRVMLPSTINFEGFILSHDVERVSPLSDDAVKAFVGRPKFKRKLDPADPSTFGAIATHENYYEFKVQQLKAMERALSVFDEVETEYEAISGRKYGAVSAFNTEVADYVAVINGCTSGTMRAAARALNREGGNFGVLAVKLYRPFPTAEVVRHLKGAKALVVMDRSLSLGAPSGPLAEDVKSALKGAGMNPPVLSVVYGIGGRDFSLVDARKVFAMAEHASSFGSEPVMYGVKA
jgi:pyruvate ferredoxin oxidoreductase alpha subunit